MGQTLTHGVYLPDEGERNCYNGLASNWSILDGAVGTIAEHTIALAGKAPAVHTHTKSDVTDLLNSNFIPSADTTYNIGSATYRWSSVWTASFKSKSTNIDLTDSVTTGNKESWYFTSYDKNENSFFSFSNQRNHSAGSNEEHFRLKNASGKWADFYLKLTDSNEFSVALSMHSDVTNKGFRGKFAPTEHLLPVANNTYELGNSSFKWKTLNSINPGALSLPKVDGWSSGTELTAAVGVDTTNWDMSGGTWNEMANNIQDGWVFFAFQGCSIGDRAIVRYYGTNARYLTMGFNAVGGSGAGYYLYVAFPMAKGSTVNIAFVTSGSVMSKFIYPCMGNV